LIDHIAAFFTSSPEQAPSSLGALILIFIAAGFVPLPRIIVCVLAGAAFGLVAIPVSVPSFTLGALGGFLAARYLLHGPVQRLVERRPLLKSIAQAVDQEGWRVVALMRLGAPIPGAMTNYVFGLSNISWWSFTWSTFLFCIPQIVLFVGVGAAGRAAILDEPISGARLTMMAIAIITCGLIIYRIARQARSAFNDMRQKGEAAAIEGNRGNSAS
jgi:uncharacterized membrane protein YdjX (TVP38/TMEM64 family)